MEGLIFAVIAASMAIWAIIDVIRGTMQMNKRILWVIVVILFPIVGPLIYYFKGRS